MARFKDEALYRQGNFLGPGLVGDGPHLEVRITVLPRHKKGDAKGGFGIALGCGERVRSHKGVQG